MTRFYIPAMLALLLSGCDRGPTEADMKDCPVSISGVTHRDVADCAADRARQEEK